MQNRMEFSFKIQSIILYSSHPLISIEIMFYFLVAVISTLFSNFSEAPDHQTFYFTSRCPEYHFSDLIDKEVRDYSEAPRGSPPSHPFESEGLFQKMADGSPIEQKHLRQSSKITLFTKYLTLAHFVHLWRLRGAPFVIEGVLKKWQEDSERLKWARKS